MKSFRRAIVVGASSGIGEAFARRLAAEGAEVALVARREDELERVRADIAAAGGRAKVYPHDVTDYDEAPLLFDRITGDLGGLDLLVYASGVLEKVPEHEYDFAKERRTFEVNLLGAAAWMNPAAAWMEAKRAGTILGVSSVAGERGRRNVVAYAASKAGLTTYLEGLRNRLHRYGVDVVTIKPGYVSTPMIADMAGHPPGLAPISADECARRSLEIARRGPKSAFVPRRWGLVMFLVRHVPSFLFRKTNF